MLPNVKECLKKTPDEVIGGMVTPFWKNHGKTCRRILWVSMLTCLFNYFYLIVSGYAGPDAICEGVRYYIGENTATGLARWFIPVVNNIFGKNVVIPLVIVVFYCLAMGVSAFLLFRLTGMENSGFQILITAAMVGFPVVTRQFAYLYTALAYGLAFLWVVLAAWFLRQRKTVTFLVGTLCLLLMLGTYQAYIGAAAAVAIICFMMDLIHEKKIAEALQNLLIYVGSGIIAGGLDLVIAKEMMKYRGIEAYDRVSSLSISDIVGNLGFTLRYSYKWFFDYFHSDVLSRNKLYLVLFVVLLALIVAHTVILIQKKKVVPAILMVLASVLLPFAMNVCVVIFPHNGIYDVMRYQYVLIIPLTFALFGALPRSIWGSMLQWLVYADVFLLIVGYSISSNASAICYKLAYESTHDQAAMMLSRVYELDGYEPQATPIVLGGGTIGYQDTYDSFGQLFRYAVMESGPVFWGGEYGLTTCRYFYFIDYLGVNPGWLTNEEYYAVLGTEEYAAMPTWPAEGSVGMVGDYAVIKIGE